MNLEVMGRQLKAARKIKYPKDTLADFSLRLAVSRATLQKMEKGDLSVAMGHYYQAARVLDLTSQFANLFVLEQDLFEAHYD